VPKARCALRDGVFDVLTAVSGLRVDRLKGCRIFGGIAVRRQYRGLPEIGVHAFNPDRIDRIDLALRQVVLVTENLRLEIADHRIARRYSRRGGRSGPQEPANQIRPECKRGGELNGGQCWDGRDGFVPLIRV